MKKIFPLIIVLISLSLIGLFILQINWFKNQVVIQEERFMDKVDKAGTGVAEELGHQAYNGPGFRLNRKQSLPLFPNDITLSMGVLPTISERYTAEDINSKLAKAFKKEGLDELRFEFAITSNSNDFEVEMQSPKFMDESLDTNHFRRRIIPIIPETGTDMEGLMAYEHIFIILPDFKAQVWKSLTWVLILSGLFTVIIIAAFYITVRTMLNQKKLSEIKSDFINNMTHELKTPLATISLAVDALSNEKVVNDKQKTAYFRGIIKEENKRMNRQVETILSAALLEKQELKLKIKPVHIHDVISKVVDNFALQLEDKNGKTELRLNAKNDLINVDEVHFTNLINNLVDNAVKYSKENLLITITTHLSGKYLVIQVQDNGIGMSRETVKRVFEKFYRAHTGNVHNVKGFGLGMSYVKTVIDAHDGKVKVDSTVGKGSTFTVEVPVDLEVKD